MPNVAFPEHDLECNASCKSTKSNGSLNPDAPCLIHGLHASVTKRSKRREDREEKASGPLHRAPGDPA